MSSATCYSPTQQSTCSTRSPSSSPYGSPTLRSSNSPHPSMSPSSRSLATPSLPTFSMPMEATDEMEMGGQTPQAKAKCSRRPVLFAMALGAVGASLAWRKMRPYTGLLQNVDGLSLHQFMDPAGRCLTPTSMESGAKLVLDQCHHEAPEQSFEVSGTTIRLRAQPELCATLSGDATSVGTPLVLEKCRKRVHAQQIVGLCLAGESPNEHAAAFAKPCDKLSVPEAQYPHLAGTSLFCFMVEMSNSAEVLLDFVAKQQHAGIYACDEQKVYEGHVSSAKTAEADHMRVWKSVFEDGRYKTHDWTVKVDPDTVWMPDQLRARLLLLKATAGEALYIESSSGKMGFSGPLEILSQAAVEKISHTYTGCHGVAPGASNDRGDGGEDAWLKACLDQSGVAPRSDKYLLSSNSKLERCSDRTYVAFHAYKGVGQWTDCIKSIQRLRS